MPRLINHIYPRSRRQGYHLYLLTENDDECLDELLQPALVEYEVGYGLWTFNGKKWGYHKGIPEDYFLTHSLPIIKNALDKKEESVFLPRASVELKFIKEKVGHVFLGQPWVDKPWEWDIRNRMYAFLQTSGRMMIDSQTGSLAKVFCKNISLTGRFFQYNEKIMIHHAMFSKYEYSKFLESRLSNKSSDSKMCFNLDSLNQELEAAKRAIKIDVAGAWKQTPELVTNNRRIVADKEALIEEDFSMIGKINFS